MKIPPSLRPLLLLEEMSRLDEPVTPTRANAELGLAKQTLHRICNRLVDEGFVEHGVENGGFVPGRRLCLMAGGILDNAHWRIIRRQILSFASEQVGETINYAVPTDGGMRYVDRVETRWPKGIELSVGSCVPFHCTASGKAFLASLPARRRRILASSLHFETFTDHTITDANHLLRELKRVAANGWANDDQEFLDGFVAAAVPVTDPKGRFVAAITFNGPKHRLPSETILRKKDMIVEAAQKLERAMFANTD